MPLKALLDSVPFYAWDLTENHRTMIFNCPACKGVMIPVIPALGIINHFRHHSGESHDWEPETEEHLSMKKWVKEQAEDCNYPCELEVIISKDVKYHIADAVINIGGANVVIECQCSNLSIKDYDARTSFYLDHGYQIIWILGGNYSDNWEFYKRPTCKLEYKIQKDFFDVFYYSNGAIGPSCVFNAKGGQLSFEELIGLTSNMFLTQKELEKLRELTKNNRHTGLISEWRRNWGQKGIFANPIIYPMDLGENAKTFFKNSPSSIRSEA